MVVDGEYVPFFPLGGRFGFRTAQFLYCSPRFFLFAVYL